MFIRLTVKTMRIKTCYFSNCIVTHNTGWLEYRAKSTAKCPINNDIKGRLCVNDSPSF